MLLIDEVQEEWELALAGFAEAGFMEQATMTRDKEEALDFLHARGVFKARAPGLPAVVVLGPTMNRHAKLSLLKEIRADSATCRLPVVVVSDPSDGEMLCAAYREGANSVVVRHADSKLQLGRYATLALFWGHANEPPRGSITPPNPGSSRR